MDSFFFFLSLLGKHGSARWVPRSPLQVASSEGNGELAVSSYSPQKFFKRVKTTFTPHRGRPRVLSSSSLLLLSCALLKGSFPTQFI